MNYQELVNVVTKEVMYTLNSGSSGLSDIRPGTEVNVSGKTIVFLLPNVDVNIESFASLLKEFKKKNQVKAYFPKWGRSLQNDSELKNNNIEVNYLDYANAANSKLINGDIFIVPVNNDNVLRKLAKLDRSNAYLGAMVQAMAMNASVFLLPSGDYEAGENLKSDIAKTRAKVCNLADIQKKFFSAPAPKPVQVPAFQSPQQSYPSVNPQATANEDSNCFTCTTHDCITRCLSKVETILKGADRIGATLGNKDIPLNIASFIDHTLLKPEATEAQVIELCAEAKKYSFASVCVNPFYVPLCAKLLEGTPVMVCTVIGFPLGATTTETKVYETIQAIANGADEIDMVINVGALKSKEYNKVEEDIREVVKACNGKTLKVILETALLNKEEKIKGCELSVKAGANFVKTSTGFGPGGATEEDIALMRAVVGPDLGVKASGGIRDTMTTLKMLNAGATRVGASASIAIVENKAPANQDKNSKY
jgi:deoxyribose-phosphate aldolase